jgi:hypothetical protein
LESPHLTAMALKKVGVRTAMVRHPFHVAKLSGQVLSSDATLMRTRHGASQLKKE